jgi:hypothetical protein
MIPAVRSCLVALAASAIVSASWAEAPPAEPEPTGATQPAAPPPVEPPEAVEEHAIAQTAPPISSDTPTLERFKQALSPHGRWVQTPEYGEVWVPNVPAGWRPYSQGQWVYTEAGWTFVSSEPWGWAPFHYGRWAYHETLGWVWIPGYEWAPAWVAWRYGDAYIGWAPLGPDGIPLAYYDTPSLWLAVGVAYFGYPLAPFYFVPTARMGPVFRRTFFAGIPRVGFYRSPPARYVARVTRRDVVRVPVRTVAPRWVPGLVYRPEARIDRGYRQGRVVAPSPAIRRSGPATRWRAPVPSMRRAPRR